MICIGFGADDSCRSRLIRWATGGDWSHVWIEYPSHCWGGRWVAHATEKGVVKEPAQRVRDRFDRTCFFEVVGLDLRVGMAASRQLFGRAYDFKVIWNALLLVFKRKLGMQGMETVAVKDISKLTCSEFVATVLVRSDFPAAMRFDPEFTTPNDLFGFCESSEVFLRL